MAEKDIWFQHIKVKELVGFAENLIQSAEAGQFVPISLQRAKAHANNPYADPEDVALLAAIDADDEVVGYFGILPILLRVGDTLHKCHWFTTWSVSSKVRGRGIGTDLMHEALTLNKDFLIVGSVHARRVCRRFGFWEREPLRYYWIDPSGMSSLNPLTILLRLCRKLVSTLSINLKIRISNPATKAIDGILSPLTRRLFYPLLTRKLTPFTRDLQTKQVAKILSEPDQETSRPAVELHRGLEAINWMLTYPWILDTGSSPTEEMDYYFSDTRPFHKFITLEIYNPKDGKYEGYVIFSVSKKKSGVFLKTLDYQVRHRSQHVKILALAIELGRRYDAAAIEIPDEVAQPLLKSFLGRAVLVAKNRIYQCHPKSENSPLGQHWQDIERHLYDGDMAFS
jgi:hypothetical protein